MAPSTGVGRTQVQERKSTYTYESVPSAPWMRPKFRPTLTLFLPSEPHASTLRKTEPLILYSLILETEFEGQAIITFLNKICPYPKSELVTSTSYVRNLGRRISS
uniref:Uncharacterized protein n=1 Tax=Rhodnius prolixus TaxID=13249 RepID=T1HG88_RHOPR